MTGLMKSPVWHSPWTKMIKGLKHSLAMKRNRGWSRKIGAGFICEDVASVREVPSDSERMKYEIALKDGTRMETHAEELNLRETEELLAFVELLQAEYVFQGAADRIGAQHGLKMKVGLKVG